MRLRTTGAAGMVALAAMAVGATPAFATNTPDGVVTPKVDCVQETQSGYVAHFTYKGEGLPKGGYRVGLGEYSSGGPWYISEKNPWKIGPRPREAGKDGGGIDWFYPGDRRYGF